MNKDNVISIIASADSRLAQINVKGDDVFALSDARKWLKAAFDEINKSDDEKGEDS